MERDSRLRHFERMNKSQVSKTRALALDLDKDDVLRTLGAIPQAASSSSGTGGSPNVPAPAPATSAAAPAVHVHHSAVGVMAAPGTTGTSSSDSSPPGTSSSGGSRLGGSEIGWGDNGFTDPLTLEDLSSITRAKAIQFWAWWNRPG